MRFAGMQLSSEFLGDSHHYLVTVGVFHLINVDTLYGNGLANTPQCVPNGAILIVPDH